VTEKLLTLLNLDHSGMEAVTSAFAAGDTDAASKALTRYFRERPEPGESMFAKPDTNAAESAEMVLRGEYVFQNTPGTLPPGPIDWTWRPTSDWEWTWFLNRHHAWPVLARAYLGSRDERYAIELADQIVSWVEGHPPDTEDKSCWRTIEAGLRMGHAWISVIPALKASSEVSDHAWECFLRGIEGHAEFLMLHQRGNNWRLMEANGLLTCGLLFPEFRRAADWIRTAIERFEAEMIAQVAPDGAHCEYSTGYHFVGTSMFTSAMDRVDLILGSDYEFAFGDDYRDRLVAMWEHVMYMLRPDGHLTLLNDADDRDVAPQLLAAGRRYGRDDFIHVATKGREGRPPEYMSHRFPYVRRPIMRNGWDSDAFYGFLESAPAGAGHVNEDALSFEIMAWGTPLIGHMGRFCYDGTQPRRQYLANGRGFNTVTIDGSLEDIKRSDRSTWVASEETDWPWVSTPEMDLGYGRYDGPWTPPIDPISWERRMVFHKPGDDIHGFWVIRDDFAGSGEHDLEFLLHFFPCEVTSDDKNRTVISHYSDANVVALFVEDGGLSFDGAKGQNDPARGWYSSEYGMIEPAWEVAAQVRCAFPCTRHMVFVPFRGDVPKVRAVVVDGDMKVVIDDKNYTIPHDV
jgi:heparinase II/III-like protein